MPEYYQIPRSKGISRGQANSLTRAINKYVSAAIDESWKGGGDPADVPELEQRLAKAHKRLREIIDSLVTKEHTK